MHLIGDVAGRDCIIVDDMIDTGGTLCKAAEALKERGAKRVFAYATHPVFSGTAAKNISESVIDEVMVTDSIPLSDEMKSIGKVKLLTLAPCWPKPSVVSATKSLSPPCSSIDCQNRRDETPHQRGFLLVRRAWRAAP